MYQEPVIQFGIELTRCFCERWFGHLGVWQKYFKQRNIEKAFLSNSQTQQYFFYSMVKWRLVVYCFSRSRYKKTIVVSQVSQTSAAAYRTNYTVTGKQTLEACQWHLLWHSSLWWHTVVEHMTWIWHCPLLHLLTAEHLWPLVPVSAQSHTMLNSFGKL